MIRSRLTSARRRVGLELLCRSFVRFAPRCGRPSRGLRAGRSFRLFAWGPLADYTLLGGLYVRFAFWLCR